jgi:HEAT repeat protein
MWFVILCVFSVVFYMSVRHHKKSKTEVPGTTGQEEVKKTSDLATRSDLWDHEEKSKDRASELKRGELKGGEEDTAWIISTSRALTDPNVSARVQAVLDLREQVSPEAIDLLVSFLDDEEGAVVSEAIDTLGYIGLNSDTAEAEKVYDILEAKAIDKNFALRAQALVTAAMIGKDRLLPIVSGIMSEDDDEGKICAVRALSVIGSPACVPYLEVLLDLNDDPEIRRNSFNTLAKIETPEALDLLQEYVGSSNDRDQAASAHALSILNRPDVNEMLADAVQEKRLEKEALQALARSPAAPLIFGDLLQRQNVEKAQKVSCLKTLAKYSTAYGSSERRTALMEAVSPLLDSPDPVIQKEAIRAIAKIGADATDKALMSKLESKDPEIRRVTVSALVGYVTPNNYKELLDLIWDDDKETRRTAFMCVQQFAGESDRKILEKAKGHPDELIRKQVPLLLDEASHQQG